MAVHNTVHPRTGSSMAVSWSTRDDHRVVTVLALTGVAIALAMAVFGLPPVDLHGPLHRMGIMDPLCGGTRAARLTVQGHWAQAWTYNPLGIVVVVGAGLVLLRAVVGLATRRWLTAAVTLSPRARTAVIAIGIIAVVVLEIRQQLRADLLIAR